VFSTFYYGSWENFLATGAWVILQEFHWMCGCGSFGSVFLPLILSCLCAGQCVGNRLRYSKVENSKQNIDVWLYEDVVL